MKPGNPGNGPAKGPGNGSPPKPFTKPDGDNPGFLAARMRHWKEKKQQDDPNWEPPARPLNSREFQELAKAAAPEAMETLISIHSNPKEMALARVRAAEIITERAHGKAVQPVIHEKKLEDATDEELLAEFARLAEENGVTIELTGESYRDISGTPEAGELEESRPVVRDLLENTRPEAAEASLVADRGLGEA